MAEYLHLDKVDGVATLTIDRPEVRNAVPGGGWDALHDLFDDVARDDLMTRKNSPKWRNCRNPVRHIK